MTTELDNLQLAGVTAPPVVLRLAAGRAVEPVWRNQLGGVTFSIGGGAEYVKYGPPDAEFDPEAEFDRLRWVRRYVPAPEPIDHGWDVGFRWSRTAGLRGTTAVADSWRRRPELAVPELGRARRRFHDRVPVAECTWTWSVADRLAGREASGIGEAPELDLVVCHGDACNPNFLLDDAGRCVGYVDLGTLGVADRWADLAAALLSLGWNYGDGWAGEFLSGYGIELDAAKLDYYTRLWDAA
jgi:kanamycin kinase